jgi:CRISPR-associated protein Cas5t
MRVLKIQAEGITTSFRYPFFMQQIHPTFEMPPPATIYGHIVSALGDWFDPAGVEFAYHFTHAGKISDLEHVILLSASTGKLKGTAHPKVMEGNVNPFERELLFMPKLTLYINKPEWIDAFRSPHYAVVLGRSQDLFTYTDVSIVELEQAEHAYFEHTLLPENATQQTARGYAVLMPQYLDPAANRRPTFARYAVLRDRVDSRDFLWFGGRPPETRYWVDAAAPMQRDLNLGLMFHGFTATL